MVRLAELVRQLPGWPDYPHSDEWVNMFESLPGAQVTGHVTEREYVLERYNLRLELAAARGGGGLGGLDEAVGRLTASTEQRFIFGLVPWRGRGFFFWLSEDASTMIAAW